MQEHEWLIDVCNEVFPASICRSMVSACCSTCCATTRLLRYSMPTMCDFVQLAIHLSSLCFSHHASLYDGLEEGKPLEIVSGLRQIRRTDHDLGRLFGLFFSLHFLLVARDSLCRLSPCSAHAYTSAVKVDQSGVSSAVKPN